MKFDAGLQGVDLEKVIKENQGQQTIKTKGGKEMTVGKEFMFAPEEEYEHLTQEERVELTKKMMGMHKKAFGG